MCSEQLQHWMDKDLSDAGVQMRIGMAYLEEDESTARLWLQKAYRGGEDAAGILLKLSQLRGEMAESPLEEEPPRAGGIWVVSRRDPPPEEPPEEAEPPGRVREVWEKLRPALPKVLVWTAVILAVAAAGAALWYVRWRLTQYLMGLCGAALLLRLAVHR